MNSAELTRAVWRKSSRSNGQANCVEIAYHGANVALRDSKDPSDGPVLRFTEGTWQSFITRVEHDHLES